MRCARHPAVETGLTCGRCSTPICPDCAVNAAVGFICRGCAKAGRSPMVVVHPGRFALTLVCVVAASIGAGLILQNVSFFLFFIAPPIGGALGQMALWLTKHKRGRTVEGLTLGSILGGLLVSQLISGEWRTLMDNPIGAAFFALGSVLMLSAAYARVRW